MVYKVSYKDFSSQQKDIYYHATSLDDLGKLIIDHHLRSNSHQAKIRFQSLEYIAKDYYEYFIDLSLDHLFPGEQGSLILSNQYNGTVQLVSEL